MRLLAYLIAGLLCAIAVAWALAAWSPRQLSRVPADSLARHPVTRTWPTLGASWFSSDTFGLSVGFASYEFHETTRGIGWDSAVYSAGLPLRCVHGFYQATLPNPSSPLIPLRRTPSLFEHGIPLPRSVAAAPISDLLPSRFLPIRPIWTGLAVNSVTMALILFAAANGPGAIRRALRRRAGRCVCCGHVLAGSAVCPECGSPGCSPGHRSAHTDTYARLHSRSTSTAPAAGACGTTQAAAGTVNQGASVS